MKTYTRQARVRRRIKTDLRRRDRAEELRLSEQRLLLALESGNLGSWETDLETGRVTFANEIFRRHFDLPLDIPLTRDDIYRAIHVEDRERLRAAVRRGVAECGDYYEEVRVVWSDGSIHRISAQGRPVAREPNGPLNYTVGMTRDITDRRAVQTRLEESERRLAEAQRIAHVGSFDWDLETLTGTCSDEMYRLLGRTPDTRQGRTKDVFDAIHPDDRPYMVHLTQQVLAGAKDLKAECRFCLPDGTIRLLRIEGETVEYEAGRPKSMVGIVQDVTEHHAQAEALREKDTVLRTVLAGAPLVLWAVDREGIFTLRTGEAKAVAAIADGDMVGQSVFDVYREYPVVLSNVRLALTGEACAYEVTINDLHFHTELLPQHDSSGKVTGIIGVSHDITKRQHAERALEEERKALRLSEARLAEAQSIAHVGSWEFNAVTNERYWSDEMYRICGYQPEDGPPTEAMVLGVYHPDDIQLREQAMVEMLATGEQAAFDFRGMRPDGTMRCIRLTARVDTDSNGKLLRIAGAAADITDRVESEERLRTLFEGSPDPLLTIDLLDGFRILDCNAAAVTILGGGDKSRLIGHNPAEFSPEFQPDGRRSQRYVSEIEEAMRTGSSYRFEWTHRTAEGNDATFEIVLSRLKLIGKPIAIALYRDLTERRRAELALRESEERLRLALESGQLGAWDVDLKAGTFLDLSDTAKLLFGRTPDVEFTWQEFLDAIHPDDLPMVRERIAYSLKNRASGYVEFRAFRADGTLRWFSTNAVLLQNQFSDYRRLIGVTQDITERKEREYLRELELLEARKRADCDPLTGLLNHRAFHKALGHQEPGTQSGVGALILFDLDNFKFFNDAYGHSVGDEVLRSVADRLRSHCSPGSTLARFGGDEFALLLTDVETAATVAEIESAVQQMLSGLVYCPNGPASAIPISVSVGAALLPSRNDAERSAAIDRADERLRRAKAGAEGESDAQRIRALSRDQVDGFSMLDALVSAVDNKDRYTRHHSEDVMDYSLLIARALGMGPLEQTVIAQAALLHDVGKIGIPDAVLRKPGLLTEQEFEAIKQHPRMGAVIVSAVRGLEATLDAILYHHEAWDGSGYPAGLKGEETPLIARLMAVADAFSAMTTSRPYRLAMDREAALAVLEAGAGTQWDPRCVAALVGALRGEEPNVGIGNIAAK